MGGSHISRSIYGSALMAMAMAVAPGYATAVRWTSAYPASGYKSAGRGYRNGKTPFQIRIDEMIRRKAVKAW